MQITISERKQLIIDREYKSNRGDLKHDVMIGHLNIHPTEIKGVYICNNELEGVLLCSSAVITPSNIFDKKLKKTNSLDGRIVLANFSGGFSLNKRLWKQM